MAELDVQPKKRSSNSFLPWLLLALGVIALVFFITRNGDRDSDEARTVAGAETTTYSTTSENAARGDWDGVDFYNAPKASFDEVKADDVDVFGNENYAIYKIDDDDLFDDGSTFKTDAGNKLTEIVQSINTRFSNGEVRVYGNADTQNAAEAGENNQRLELLKNWLMPSIRMGVRRSPFRIRRIRSHGFSLR